MVFFVAVFDSGLVKNIRNYKLTNSAKHVVVRQFETFNRNVRYCVFQHVAAQLLEQINVSRKGISLVS